MCNEALYAEINKLFEEHCPDLKDNRECKGPFTRMYFLGETLKSADASCKDWAKLAKFLATMIWPHLSDQELNLKLIEMWRALGLWPYDKKEKTKI